MEMCQDCKRKQYNCRDWCLQYLKHREVLRGRSVEYDEAHAYDMEKIRRLKKNYK